MTEFRLELVVGFLLLALGIAGVGWLISSMRTEAAEKERLIQQCMDDNKKEYECRALFARSQSQVIPVPIIIPSGR